MRSVAYQGLLNEQGASEVPDDEARACWALIAGSENVDASHKPPLVSIVITAYNYEKYIEECIRSVHRQNYAKFECIIVDDCSVDGTRARAQATLAALSDRRFAIASLPSNVGQLAAQSFGFARTQGQFVIFVDADDLLKPDFIARHLYAHLNLPTVVGFTSSDQWHIDAEGTVLSFHHPDLINAIDSAAGRSVTISDGAMRALNVVVLETAALGKEFGEWCWATQSTMMFRRGLLELILPDPAQAGDYRTCADFYLARFAHLLGASAVLREALGCYRRHGRNNFCSNPLLAADVPVGNMRKHPTIRSFYALALSMMETRSEAFLSVLGDWRYKQFLDTFRELEHLRARSRRASWRQARDLAGIISKGWEAAIRKRPICP